MHPFLKLIVMVGGIGAALWGGASILKTEEKKPEKTVAPPVVPKPKEEEKSK